MIKPEEWINKPMVRGKKLITKGEDDEAINYFDYILPRLRETEEFKKMTVIEGI